MKTFLFITTTNDPKSCIEPVYIRSTNVSEALLRYRLHAKYNAHIYISDNALNTKRAGFCDLPDGGSVQVGYVIQGKIDNVNVDLWVKIEEIINPFI